MFFQCQSTMQLWHDLATLYGFPLVSHASTHAAFEWWSGQRDSWRSIIIIVLWCAWRWRNNIIFKTMKEPFKAILQHILSIYDSVPIKQPKRKYANRNEQEDYLSRAPIAFLDGAAQKNYCGCGVHIIMDENLQYFISWNGGKGSNNMAEARALAGLLAFCIFFDIESISIFGDSKIMVDHVKGKCHIRSPHLAGWMDRIMFFWGLVKGCSIQHIYRAQNQQAYILSKEGLLLETGT